MNQAHILKKIDDWLLVAIAKPGVNIDPVTTPSEFTGELPKGGTGKILKRKLR